LDFSAICGGLYQRHRPLIALAIAVAAIYGQVTVNDMIMARYTADAWRGRVCVVRYFLLFISAGAAIGMISILHESGGFALVLGVNAIIALLLFLTTLALVAMIINVEASSARHSLLSRFHLRMIFPRSAPTSGSCAKTTAG
jgi:hypothetical protein